jgi:hypothetical protein
MRRMLWGLGAWWLRDGLGRSGGAGVLLLDLFEHLFAVYRDSPWSFNAEADLVAVHFEDDNFHVISDHDRLTASAGENQHD